MVVGFGVVFALFGVGFLIPFFILPVWNSYQAQSWSVTECKVITSAVGRHTGDDSTTYSVDISYDYEVDGKVYHSDRYKFMSGSSSGYNGKKEVVDQYPPGKVIRCYYDPSDPSKSVIERGFTSDMLFGLIPLFFVVVGLAIAIFGGRAAANSKNRLPGQASSSSHFSRSSYADTQPKVVAQSSPVVRLFGMTFVALFWNGIVSVFLYHIVQGWFDGKGSWFETLFISPFVLIGLLLIFGIFHSFLGLFNPRVTITIQPSAVPIGGKLQLRWSFKGNSSKIKKIVISLAGREEATYRRGTDTVTDKRTFFEEEVLSISNRHQISSGDTTIEVPSHLMHSFSSNNNKIAWQVSFRGEIPKWPDISESFDLQVLPLTSVDLKTGTV